MLSRKEFQSEGLSILYIPIPICVNRKPLFIIRSIEGSLIEKGRIVLMDGYLARESSKSRSSEEVQIYCQSGGSVTALDW